MMMWKYYCYFENYVEGNSAMLGQSDDNISKPNKKTIPKETAKLSKKHKHNRNNHSSKSVINSDITSTSISQRSPLITSKLTRVPQPDPMDNVSPDSKKSSENMVNTINHQLNNNSNNYHSQNTLKPHASESQIDIIETPNNAAAAAALFGVSMISI
jgi:hypothetical protein